MKILTVKASRVLSEKRLRQYYVVILASVFCFSCSGATPAVETAATTSTSTSSTSSTTTTINLGRDCNSSFGAEFAEQVNTFRDTATGSSESASLEQMRWISNFRSYIRQLDLPTIVAEQSALVRAAEGWYDGINLYLQSGRTDLTVNERQLAFRDALEDFVYAFTRACG